MKKLKIILTFITTNMIHISCLCGCLLVAISNPPGILGSIALLLGGFFVGRIFVNFFDGLQNKDRL